MLTFMMHGDAERALLKLTFYWRPLAGGGARAADLAQVSYSSCYN